MKMYETVAKVSAVAQRSVRNVSRSIESTVESHGGVGPMLHNGARTAASYAGKVAGTVVEEFSDRKTGRPERYKTNAAKSIDDAIGAAKEGVETIVTGAKKIHRNVRAEYATRRDKIVTIDDMLYKMAVDTKTEANAVRGYMTQVAPMIPATNAGKHDLLMYIAQHAVTSTPQLRREKHELTPAAKKTLTYLK